MHETIDLNKNNNISSINDEKVIDDLMQEYKKEIQTENDNQNIDDVISKNVKINIKNNTINYLVPLNKTEIKKEEENKNISEIEKDNKDIDEFGKNIENQKDDEFWYERDNGSFDDDEYDNEYGTRFGFGNIEEDDEINLLKDRLLKYIKKGDFKSAEILFNEIKNTKNKDYKIYLAKVMLDMKVSRIDMLSDCLELYDYANTSTYYKKFYNLCGKELRDILKSYVNSSYLKKKYQKALSIFEKATKDFDKELLKEAQDNFSKLDDYKDSENLYDECSFLLTEWENKEQTYNSLLSKKSQWLKASIDDLTKDKNELIELSNYKESNNLLELINSILELKEKEKNDFIKRMNNEKILFLFLSFTFVALIAIMVKFDLCDDILPFIGINFLAIIVTGIHLILRWFVGLIKNFISLFTKK